MTNRLNLARLAIFSLLFSSMVLIAPGDQAQAAGGGLSVSIRSDDRTLAWVKSQGFDAWYGGECYSASNLVLTQNWGQAEPAAGCGVDNFQLFANGYIKAPATGQYDFRITANDAFELRINGKEVLKYWAGTTAGGTTYTTTAAQAQNLVAGNVYPIHFWYRDFTKEAHFKVQWKYPGSGDFADIPVEYLDDSANTLLGAGNKQEINCASGVGFSADCPAYSPQEIFEIHGTQTDGEYWLLVAGVPTKVHVILDPTYSVDGVSGFVQLMYIPSANGGGYTGLSSAGARFNYDSPLWTDNYLTLNAGAGATAMASKRNTYNYTPLSKVMAIYKRAGNYSLNSTANNSWNSTYTVNTGDLELPNWGQSSDLVWVESVPAFATGKSAKYTFDNQISQTEAVVEPVKDGQPSSGVTTTSRSVKRVKISIDQTRKNKLIGLLTDRKAFGLELNKLSIQAPKTGTFAAAKNPYNEWYGFNFRAREWASTKPLVKMRWGFYSMGFQTTFSQITSDGRNWSDTYRDSIGEQAPSSPYAPSACTDGGCGYQLQYSYYGPLTRFLAIGGIGLQDANAAAYQPQDTSLSDVVLNNGSDLVRPQCPAGKDPYTSGVVSQPLLGYKCAYTAAIYGQMPNPSLSTVSSVTATNIDNGFKVTWSAVAGATEYVFASRKLGESWKAVRIQNASTLEQILPERGPGTYEFKVSARKYDSPISFSSSVPTTASKEVGVGLGGGDELLLANGESSVDLESALSSSKLALSGLLPNTTVGLTVTVTSASATISTVAGLSTYSNLINTLTTAISLNSQSSSVTVYGSSTSVQATLDSISYQHLDPQKPEGSIKIEAFDAGNSTYKFNPANKHYYSITQSQDIYYRDAYCFVIQGQVTNLPDRTSGNYNACPATSGQGRLNYNGVMGYLATITSDTELNWLSSSGVLSGIDTKAWIGATALEPRKSGTLGTDYQWTVDVPTLERQQLIHQHTGNNGAVLSSLVSGISFRQDASDRYSVTVERNSGQYRFANADSNGNSDVNFLLIEYSDDNGNNPLYKSRTIRFALAPEITSVSVGSITSKSSQISIGVDPGNNSTTIEVSYSAQTANGQETGFAVVSPATTDSSGVVSAKLSGLQPFTTYSYTVTLTNQGGSATQTGSFMTGAGIAEALGIAATNVTSTSATLGVSIRPNASALTSISLEYSVNANLSSATSIALSTAGLSGTGAEVSTKNITGLSPETTYYFRTTVVNSAGSSTSEILSFTTGKDLGSITNQFDPSNSQVVLPGGLEIKANNPNVFPVDFNRSPAQDSLYVSYTVKNTSASTQQDLWLSLRDFSGGSVQPVFPGETTQFIGDLAAGQSKTVYFFLKATGLTELDQEHVVKVSQGQPGTDAESTSSSIVFAFDAVRDLGASSTTISDIRFNTSAPPLGGDFKITTVGKFDALVSSGDGYFLSPAVTSNWPADSLRLDQIRLVFPNITATLGCTSVILDLQLITNSCYQGQQFEATYNFKVIDTPATSFNVNPGVLTGDTAGWLGTDSAENPAVLVNLRPQQNLSVTTTISDAATSSQVLIGAVTYSQVTVEVQIDNTSLRSSSLDQVLIDLETSTKFDPNTAYLSINGTRYSVSATVVDSTSNVIAIDGPIPAKAGDDVKLVFEVQVPLGTTDALEVTGKIGDVEVGPTPGTSTTATIEVDSTGAVSASATTTATSPRIDGVAAADVFGTTALLRGKVADGVAGVTVSFKIGQSPDLGFNTKLFSGSPFVLSGAGFEVFEAHLTGLAPGSTYYYQALYNGIPGGEILSFTTLAEDKPFVGLSSQPLPVAAICDESELSCPTTVINPPVVSCNDCSLSYTISSGVLPPGMNLDPATGVISGTPTGSGGNYPFTLTATATGSDPSASPMVASQAYNLVTQPSTAEPKIQSASAGNISKDSAIITATGNYIPNGELVKLIVSYTDSSNVLQTIVNEVVAEGLGTGNQLISFDLKNLIATTTYSYQLVFGNQRTDWFEFATTAVETVPATAAVTDTAVNVVNDSVAEISATISNPLPGDALGFVVGTNQSLTDGKTYIAGSSEATSQQLVSTQVTNLSPGTYYYRVLLGDGLSPLVYPFTIGTQSGGSGSGGFGSGVTQDNNSSTSSAVTKYKSVFKKYSFYFAPGVSKLTRAQELQLLGIIENLPANRFGTKLTSIGWAAARPVLASDRSLSLQRARQVTNLAKDKLTAQIRAVGDRRANNSSKSARRVDVWIAYKIPEN